MKTDIIPYQKMTAEAILYKENDPLLRYAIYKAYKYRCAYTGKFLYDYSSIHLDHIIPQDTAPEVLQEKIRKYHLADDFTIDSLENILPTKSLHNNSQKNRHPFSEPAERFFLEYAQRGKWKIEREYKILKKQFELSKLKVFAEAQLVEFNLLPPEVYKASRKVTNSLSIHNHFWRSTENIALNGFLPSKLKEEGSCVISFCNRTIMITLDHKTILQLINKLETYSLNDIILRGHSYQNTKTFVVYFVTNSSPVIGIGDPVASVGRLPFSFTDRRNSSLRSSDTTGRAFRKSKTTLARAPMVANPDHLRLTLSLNCRLVLI